MAACSSPPYPCVRVIVSKQPFDQRPPSATGEGGEGGMGGAGQVHRGHAAEGEIAPLLITREAEVST